jgi:AcrR family transcriptional regulator
MPPVRADARRNRELVLRTTSDMFADEGMAVSLIRIAERAGVGAGTVYRHFPSKEELVEAVLAELVSTFTAAADRWAERAEPGDALIGFLTEVIE